MTNALGLAVLAHRKLPDGPVAVQVGKAGYGIPEDARYLHRQDGRLLVVLYKTRVHALVDRGELLIPEPLQGPLVRHYFGSRR